MVRLATRRTTPRGVRYSVRKAAAPAYRRAAAKRRRAATVWAVSPIFVARVKSFLNTLHTYQTQRRHQYGANDAVARKLQSCHTAINGELRKVNPLNPNLSKCFKQISMTLRGVPNVPASVRTGLHTLPRMLRNNVNTDIARFLNKFKLFFLPMQTELRRLESQLHRQMARTRSGSIKFKIDPALKRRFVTLNNDIARFKTKWAKRLNGITLNGNKIMYTAVNMIKKQIDMLHKECRKSIAILKRKNKAIVPSTRRNAAHLITAGQVNTVENKWNYIERQLEKYRIPVDQFIVRLKAVKMF